MDMVAAATHLPADLIWWKSHNFVEMSYELITDGDYPQIKNELLTALYDTEAKKTAAQILSSYAGVPPEPIVDIFNNAPNIFAIDDISAEKLAFKQDLSYKIRHNINDADIDAMTKLLSKMSQELRCGYYPFIKQLISLTAQALSSY